MLLKVVGALRGHSLSVCPRLEEETTLWYLREAVLLPPVSCFEMFVNERDTTDSLLSFPFRVPRAPVHFLLSALYILSLRIARFAYSPKSASNACCVFPILKTSLRKV